MAAARKSLYHSEMVAISPFTCVITSEPLMGKDRKNYYLCATLDGEERYLSCEHQGCADAMAGWNGHEVRITASGSRDSAQIIVEPADQIPGAEAPARPAPARPAPAPRAAAPARPTAKPYQLKAPTAPARAPVQQAPKPAPVDPVVFIAQAANLYRRCMDAATFNVLNWSALNADAIGKQELPPPESAMIQAQASALFIAADRAGLAAQMETEQVP